MPELTAYSIVRTVPRRHIPSQRAGAGSAPLLRLR